MIRIASADHGSGMPPGWEMGAATLTSTRSPPPDSGNAATVCAPSPSEPGAGRSTACLSAARSPAPPVAPIVAATSSRCPSEIATAPPARSAIPDIRPTSRIRVETSTGHSERPVSATGHAATASTCPAASSRPAEAWCPWRASRTIERASKVPGSRDVTSAVFSSSYRPKPSTPRRNGSHHGSVSSRSRSVS